MALTVYQRLFGNDSKSIRVQLTFGLQIYSKSSFPHFTEF